MRHDKCISKRTNTFRKHLLFSVSIIVSVTVLSSCIYRNVDSVGSVSLGFFEAFIEENGIPYKAPEEKGDMFRLIVGVMADTDKVITALPEEVASFIESPDVVDLRVTGNDDFVGLSLTYILSLKERNYFNATYLSIDYNKLRDNGGMRYVENGNLIYSLSISAELLRTVIYPIEEKYSDEIRDYYWYKGESELGI